MQKINDLKMVLDSKSVNEGFARSAVAAFVAQLDPTTVGKIYINVSLLEDRRVKISVRDKGCGILNVKQAMEPLFTTLGGERAGLGFAVMESFTDRITVHSKPEKGTTVTMYKTVNGRADI